MTKIYLIRHGETEGAEKNRYKGHIDVPLSENGIEQIKRVSDYLGSGTHTEGKWEKNHPPLSAVYSSDLSRALKSAEIIAEPHGLKPQIREGLKERNFGVWEGMSFDEISAQWPDAFRAWAEDPLRFSPMEGESTLDARDRAMPAFEEIINNHKDENIAIVSHGGVIRIILCELLGIPLENIFRIEQDFAALNLVEMWDYPVVRHINYVV